MYQIGQPIRALFFGRELSKNPTSMMKITHFVKNLTKTFSLALLIKMLKSSGRWNIFKKFYWQLNNLAE